MQCVLFLPLKRVHEKSNYSTCAQCTVGLPKGIRLTHQSTVVNPNSDGMKWLTTPIHTLLTNILESALKKSIKLRLSNAFAIIRNIAQRAKLCKTVQNVPNSLYSFKWKTRAYLWIVEIRCWKFLTNFIPKYHCGDPLYLQINWENINLGFVY